ncbi:c-type cytochrome [Flavobacterium ardleyense]|uniref:C-type cytochrome n=1 Tax=Flavobacterium ardleyense TaxID=2038737 RepID=A0ABW5Z527_9FLAO
MSYSRITKFTLLTLLVLLVQLSCTEQRIENKTTLNKYADGKLLRESVKYQDNDTITEFTYFKNGKLNYKRQLLNNKRVGWSYTYNKRGQVTLKVDYLARCEQHSCECNQTVTAYENGSKVYSYEVTAGLKSEKHTVYDQEVYKKLKDQSTDKSDTAQGKIIFQNNCGMCHRVEKQLVGIALSSFSNTMNADELVELLAGNHGHPWTKSTQQEADQLISYINSNCN